MIPPRSNFGTDTIQPAQQPPGTVRAYAAGGAIDTGEEDLGPLGNTLGAQLQQSLSQAMQTVGSVLSYGRSLHGLGGEQEDDQAGAIDTAGVMPSTPFRETPVERPMPRPDAYPLPPGQKPFGKRVEGEGSFNTAGVMPGTPFRETPVERPMPRPDNFPLPPGQVPFGKRVSEAEPEEDTAGAIDTEETA
jgi:hypothetical protein